MTTTQNPSEKDQEEYIKRVFTSGYVLGQKHGYANAVEESYPELRSDATEVDAIAEDGSVSAGNMISDYLNRNLGRSDSV